METFLMHLKAGGKELADDYLTASCADTEFLPQLRNLSVRNSSRIHLGHYSAPHGVH